MNILRDKDIRNLIIHNNGNREKTMETIKEALAQNSNLIYKAPMVQSYISADERREHVNNILLQKNTEWVKHIHTLRDFSQDSLLRERLLEIYQTSPWMIQTIKTLGEIFTYEYFVEHFKNIQYHSQLEKDIFSLFLLFYGTKDIDSHAPSIQNILKERVKYAPTLDATLVGKKDAGFACGGMEDNYEIAANINKGICLINGGLFAKYFHRKGSPKKVSYLPAKTYKTENGLILWEDYLYGPTDEQHTYVMKAIEEGKEQLYIPNLVLKAARPANGITSEKIRKILEDKYGQSIK